MTVNENEILRFGKGTIIHLDVLGWSDKKQKELEMLAMESIVLSNKAGRCYHLLNELIESPLLPKLANGIVLTLTLLGELLRRSNRFRLLGNTQNAYVPIPNDWGIVTFEDLVYELLKTKYDGASKLEIFEKDIQEAGIIKKKMMSGMLGDQKKVIISDYVIMLRELYSSA